MCRALILRGPVECQWWKCSSGDSKNENCIDKIYRMWRVALWKKVFVKDQSKAVATPALGLSLSYEMREDFVKFILCETRLKLFNLIHIKSNEAGHRTNDQCLWWQLLFVLNVLSSSGSRKIARQAVQRNNERETIFKHFSNRI